MHTTTDLPPLLTADETARLLRLSVRSLANDRCLGRGLPYVKLRGAVRYRREDILGYIDAATIHHGADHVTA